MKPFIHLMLGLGLMLTLFRPVLAQSDQEAPTRAVALDYSTLIPVGVELSLFVLSYEQELWHSEGELIHLYGSLGPSVDALLGISRIWGLAGGVSGTLGRRANRLELELDVNWFLLVDDKNQRDTVFLMPRGYYFPTRVYPLINLAYRYQPPRSGVVFRVKAGTGGVGLGVGYAF